MIRMTVANHCFCLIMTIYIYASGEGHSCNYDYSEWCPNMPGRYEGIIKHMKKEKSKFWIMFAVIVIIIHTYNT